MEVDQSVILGDNSPDDDHKTNRTRKNTEAEM